MNFLCLLLGHKLEDAGRDAIARAKRACERCGQVLVPCPKCRGSGLIYADDPTRPWEGGREYRMKGDTVLMDYDGKPLLGKPLLERCPACRGKKRVHPAQVGKCPSCGEGPLVVEDESLIEGSGAGAMVGLFKVKKCSKCGKIAESRLIESYWKSQFGG